MKKEQYWYLKVDGTRHEVKSVDRGNSFDVYVDDEFRYTVRSDINLDIEEDLTVGGKHCRFVVYAGVPDLAVDGILMNANADLVKAENRSRFFTILGGICLMILGIYAVWTWMALRMSGEDYFGGVFAPLFSALVFGAGAYLVVRVLRKREY